jgi:hypothetical protein
MSSTKQRGPSGATVFAVAVLSLSSIVLTMRLNSHGKRISALEQDVQTLIEFMPQVVEKEASGD